MDAANFRKCIEPIEVVETGPYGRPLSESSSTGVCDTRAAAQKKANKDILFP
jgi:hypothetical protein